MLKPIKLALTLSLLGSALAAASPVAAQGYGYDHRPDQQSPRHETQAPQQYHRDQGRYPQTWYRGQRFDRAQQNHSYVVTNWRRAHLRSPGRGRHWVRTEHQYVLISIRSGIVYGTASRRR